MNWLRQLAVENGMARNADEKRAINMQALGAVVDALVLIALTETPEVRDLLREAAKSTQRARDIIAASRRDTLSPKS